MSVDPSVLIFSDDEKYAGILKETLTEAEYHVICSDAIAHSLKHLREEKFFAVIISVNKPAEEHLDFLKLIKQNYTFTEVLFVVKWPDANSAYSSSLLGAYDYISRIPEVTEYVQIADRIFSEVKRKYKKTNSAWVKNSSPIEFLPQIIGEHPCMKSVLNKIDKTASSDLPVLLLGETGTGKELLAQRIHKKSLRRNSPFIVMNCAAVPETLLENELFGHEKGAFTNASARKPGLLEEAHSGTLFLDEIGELSPLLQSKLLRVVETGKFRRLGGSGEEIKSDVRIVTATNKDLYSEVQKNAFRADLYYRLAVVSISIPPLRERKEDIALLTEHFLEIANKYSRSAKIVSASALKMLNAYDWPGNIRELKNCIERLVVLSGDGTRISITPADIADVLPNICSYGYVAKTQPGTEIGQAEGRETQKNNMQCASLEEIERRHIEYTFEVTGRDHEKTAEILGIPSRILYNKLLQHGIIKQIKYL